MIPETLNSRGITQKPQSIDLFFLFEYFKIYSEQMPLPEFGRGKCAAAEMLGIPLT